MLAIDLVDKVADHVRAHYGLRARKAVEKLGGRLATTQTRLAEGETSLYVSGRCDFLIVLYAYEAAGVANVRIAHELGHYLLHTVSGQQPRNFTYGNSHPGDADADLFAQRYLLRPEEACDLLARYKSPSAAALNVGVDTGFFKAQLP